MSESTEKTIDAVKLQQRVAFELLESSNRSYVVFAAGPLTRQPNTQPFRIVMVRWKRSDGFDKSIISVHTEVFQTDGKEPNEDLVDFCSKATSSLQTGEYFGLDNIHAACEVFACRLLDSVSSIGSVMRDVVSKTGKG